MQGNVISEMDRETAACGLIGGTGDGGSKAAGGSRVEGDRECRYAVALAVNRSTDVQG